MTAQTALARLDEVHPQHVQTIAEATASLLPGSLVTLGDVRGGRFFTGMGPGDRVFVVAEAYRYLVAIDAEHPSMAVSREDFEPVDPSLWGAEDFRTAKAVAERAALAAMESAFTLANGWNYGARREPDEDAALAALGQAGALRAFAFACGIAARFA